MGTRHYRTEGENELAADIQEALSAYLEQNQPWFEDADQRRSDAEEMHRIVADWEQDNGKLTRQERKQARARLSNRRPLNAGSPKTTKPVSYHCLKIPGDRTHGQSTGEQQKIEDEESP